uniref:Uncharacterized protein n=1 Tax=Rhizophora mucronata TaxID=61149 RepID=A0A2P2Q874_RHIMU
MQNVNLIINLSFQWQNFSQINNAFKRHYITKQYNPTQSCQAMKTKIQNSTSEMLLLITKNKQAVYVE